MHSSGWSGDCPFDGQRTSSNELSSSLAYFSQTTPEDLCINLCFLRHSQIIIFHLMFKRIYSPRYDMFKVQHVYFVALYTQATRPTLLFCMGENVASSVIDDKSAHGACGRYRQLSQSI